MMEIKGRLDNIVYNLKQREIISFELDEIIGNIDDLIGKDLTLKIEPYSAKRTKSANSYMWELILQISKATHTDTISIYRDAVKHAGIYRTLHIPIKDYETQKRIWENTGKAWFFEDIDFFESGIESIGTIKVVHAFYGSSCYDKKQMNRLIEHVKQDAIALNINVLTPEQQAKLIDEWNRKDL